MKTFTYILIGLISAMMLACGEKDPLKDYESLNTAVVPYQIEKEKRDIKNQLFFIDVNERSQLSFVQGVPGEVQFSTRLGFSKADEVKYNLVIKEGPMALGAKFVRVAANNWALKWTPSANLLTASENFKKIRVVIQFTLLPQSSEYVKAQFAGDVDTREFEITLNKDLSVPVIEDDLKITPALTLNPDQSATVRFTTAAKGLVTADSLQVNLISGPQSLSNELAQIDGRLGNADKAVREGKALGVDTLGRTRYQYKVDFDTRLFLDKAMAKVRANDVLNRKFSNGELKEIEAAFYIEAVNAYNGMRSAQKMIILKVNLSDSAGSPLIAGLEAATVKAGNQSSQQFFIRASDARGEIFVKSFQLGEQVSEMKGGTAALSDSDINIKLTCSNGTPGLNEQFNCRTGKCYQTCLVDAEVSCEMKPKKLALTINAESKIGANIQAKALIYSVNIQGKNKNCAATPAIAAAQGEK